MTIYIQHENETNEMRKSIDVGSMARKKSMFGSKYKNWLALMWKEPPCKQLPLPCLGGGKRKSGEGWVWTFHFRVVMAEAAFLQVCPPSPHYLHLSSHTHGGEWEIKGRKSPALFTMLMLLLLLLNVLHHHTLCCCSFPEFWTSGWVVTKPPINMPF